MSARAATSAVACIELRAGEFAVTPGRCQDGETVRTDPGSGAFLRAQCVGIREQRPKVPRPVVATAVDVNSLRAALTYVPADSLRTKLII